MENKTCGECKWFVLDGSGFCRSNEGEECRGNDACSFFDPKVITNGDKIIAGGMRAIAKLVCGEKCAICVYSTYEEDVGFGEAGWTCNRPKDKDCVDGIEAWLNAPAVCVPPNGKNDTQADLCCKSAKESEEVESE